MVRWGLVEAAHQVVRRCPVLRAYRDRIRHGKQDRSKKAIVATGRELLPIMFAMLRDRTPFDAARVRPSAAA